MQEEQKKEIGNMIRRFRTSRVQIHNGHPWTQEDLAVAIGSDKAHVNRIENGRQIPTLQTLQKICSALTLNWSQTKKLMASAGCLFVLPSVMEEEADDVVGRLASKVKTLEQPVTVQDKESIMWDVNDLEAYTFYGYRSARDFLEECRGFRIIELLMTPKFDKWFSRIILNYEEYLRRQIMRFMELYFPRKYDSEYQNILNHLLHIQEFRKIWNELLEENQENQVIFLNHQELFIDHPDLGRYDIQIWHSDISIDDRFILVQHTAANKETEQMFSELWHKYNPGKRDKRRFVGIAG